MSRDSYVSTILAWRRFLQGVDEEMAKSNEMVRQVALLTALHDRAQELVLERDSLKASMAAVTHELQEVLRTGRSALNYLNTAVKVQVPPESPELKKLGIRTGGRPRGSRKAPTPRE